MLKEDAWVGDDTGVSEKQDSEVLSCDIAGDGFWGSIVRRGSEVCRTGLRSAVNVREILCRCSSGRVVRGFLEFKSREGMLSKMHFTTRPQRRHIFGGWMRRYVRRQRNDMLVSGSCRK